MMMEDDWLFCPHALESLRYFLSKAYRYDPGWLALRVSHPHAGGDRIRPVPGRPPTSTTGRRRALGGSTPAGPACQLGGRASRQLAV